ncbi:hypothetical protein PROFUN_00737 [Planoprotostelium fungivorum]|uniref:Cyclin-like domain-containing protein n=1 Tax=Planoprotostelium fungivorum TaxID=1890364 RepID=A0A2P6NUB4_9EUKA|nr:hypothetical protein PROFUN_00737 [Planoprotostelium fungivorum]
MSLELRFHVSADVLEKTPSRCDGISEDLETAQRVYACEMIQDAGILLKLPQVTIATAQVLLQRFYYRSSLARHCSKSAAISSLFLACKVAETPRKTRDLLNVFHRLLCRSQEKREEEKKGGEITFLEVGGQEYWKLKNDCINTERFMLKELGFIVYVVLPYKYIIFFIKLLDAPPEVRQRTWNYVNDSLRTPACVVFGPEVVAAACIYMAARDLSVPLPESPSPWYLLFETSLDQITQVCWHIQQLYKMAPAQYINTRSDRYKNETFDEDEEVEEQQPTPPREREGRSPPSPKRGRYQETPERNSTRQGPSPSRGYRSPRRSRSPDRERRSRSPRRNTDRRRDREEHYQRRDSSRDRESRDRERDRDRDRDRRR